jgi:predicted component of type VI protein secretion system
MELSLKVVGGKSAGTVIPVAGPAFLIGRADECQLRPKSETVSRRHARLTVEDEKAFICDMGSRTGTFVNGHLLPAKQDLELHNGDVIRVGPVELSVGVKYTLARQKKPPVESLEEAAARQAVSAEDVDVTQWLQPEERDMSLGETIDEAPRRTVVSAADLLGHKPKSADDKKSDQNQSGDDPAPDRAAEDMLKNYLRRR